MRLGECCLEYERLKRICHKYNFISFDIFDTLLKRDVSFPSDVFELTEQIVSKQYPGRFAGFAQKRIQAEKDARERSGYDDITLNEIYDEIEYTQEDQRLLKKAELDTEKRVLHANPPIKDIYEDCRNGGKIIYIVSDMYLPKDFLEDILHSEGYTGYKKLFLSCEYRQIKKNGTLFRILCKEEKVAPREILHIGDSRIADCLGALKAGMRFSHINRRENNTLYFDMPERADSLDKKVLFSFINNRETLLESRELRLGYEVLGPILYGYCQWLHEQIKGLKVRVWFAARDMYLFAQAYERMYGEEENVEYIYLSRRSLRPVYTDAAGDLTKAGDVFSGEKYSISQIVEYLGYSLDNIHAEDDMDIVTPRYDARLLGENREILKILDTPEISAAEKELSRSGYTYLKEHGLFSNDIALADVGWHGTTQYILSVIQSKYTNQHHIRGYYIGCMNGTDDKIGKENYKAFLFDEHSDPMFKKGTLLFESMLQAPHGSTIRYEKGWDEEVPVLDQIQAIPQIILDIQKGAFRFIEDMCRSSWKDDMVFQSATVKQMFEKLTGSPRKEELKSIGNLEYENISRHRLADPKNLGYYLFHYREFINDLHYAPWRIGFLKRLMRIRFPYDRMDSMLRRLYQKRNGICHHSDL